MLLQKGWIGNYLKHIWLHSLLQGIQSVFCPLLGTFMAKSVSEYPRLHHNIRFNFAAYTYRCLWLWSKYPIVDSDKLLTYFCIYSSCWLYCQMSTCYTDMEGVIYDDMLLPILAASSLTECFHTIVLGHILGRGICCVTADILLYVLLLPLSTWCIQSSRCPYTWFWFYPSGWDNCGADPWCCGKGGEDDNGKWEVQRIIPVATS